MQAIEHSFPLADIEKALFELAEKQKQFDVIWLKQQFKQFVAGYQEGTPTVSIEYVNKKVENFS